MDGPGRPPGDPGGAGVDGAGGLRGVVLAVRTRRGAPALSVAVPGIGEVTVAGRTLVASGVPAPGDEVRLEVVPESVVVLQR